mmetsp:Transcript_6387/g.11938  ORF Transcript_6387/g.11938 Transcript_6387/m.11938 type:complete len:410 (-) Transcript_6387:321-1550(-)
MELPTFPAKTLASTPSVSGFLFLLFTASLLLLQRPRNGLVDELLLRLGFPCSRSCSSSAGSAAPCRRRRRHGGGGGGVRRRLRLGSGHAWHRREHAPSQPSSSICTPSPHHLLHLLHHCRVLHHGLHGGVSHCLHGLLQHRGILYHRLHLLCHLRVTGHHLLHHWVLHHRLHGRRVRHHLLHHWAGHHLLHHLRVHSPHTTTRRHHSPQTARGHHGHPAKAAAAERSRRGESRSSTAERRGGVEGLWGGGSSGRRRLGDSRHVCSNGRPTRVEVLPGLGRGFQRQRARLAVTHKPRRQQARSPPGKTAQLAVEHGIGYLQCSVLGFGWVGDNVVEHLDKRFEPCARHSRLASRHQRLNRGQHFRGTTDWVGRRTSIRVIVHAGAIVLLGGGGRGCSGCSSGSRKSRGCR